MRGQVRGQAHLGRAACARCTSPTGGWTARESSYHTSCPSQRRVPHRRGRTILVRRGGPPKRLYVEQPSSTLCIPPPRSSSLSSMSSSKNEEGRTLVIRGHGATALPQHEPHEERSPTSTGATNEMGDCRNPSVRISPRSARQPTVWRDLTRGAHVPGVPPCSARVQYCTYTLATPPPDRGLIDTVSAPLTVALTLIPGGVAPLRAPARMQSAHARRGGGAHVQGADGFLATGRDLICSQHRGGSNEGACRRYGPHQACTSRAQTLTRKRVGGRTLRWVPCQKEERVVPHPLNAVGPASVARVGNFLRLVVVAFQPS